MIKTGAIIAAFLAACLFARHAKADECKPIAVVAEQIATMPVLSAPRVVIGDKAIAMAVAIFNASPPESDASYNFAVLVGIADSVGGGGLLLVGNDGSVCQAVRFTAQQWLALTRFVEGQAT